MKRKFALSFVLIAVVACATVMGNAQALRIGAPQSVSNAPAQSQQELKVDSRLAFAYQPHNNKMSAQQLKQGLTPANLQMVGYSIVAAQDGLLYSGVIVGTDPTKPKFASAVPTLVVPIRFQFLDANQNVAFDFDPDAAQPCFAGKTTTNLVVGSPILNPSPLVMNGANVGNVQYVDGFQRASFWAFHGANPNYHVKLNPIRRATITILVSNGFWQAGNVGCGPVGAIDINLWDNFVQTTLLPLIGAQTYQFPMFFTYNMAWTAGGCCAVGYHNAVGFQTYSSTAIPTPDFFGASFSDTVALSHEVGEWMDDPLTNNPTPLWGNIGQVGGCQANLEVGDPLTPVPFPPINMNGYTYHLQEMAFFSAFYGGPSLGAGGAYSNNGSFGALNHWLALCPPGGLN